ncbi:MAG: hypothetical protein MK008_01785 [Bdellovibrionales bacterium]|nr:hypothetical protein [Bdellovibrionales bacterium]
MIVSIFAAFLSISVWAHEDPDLSKIKFEPVNSQQHSCGGGGCSHHNHKVSADRDTQAILSLLNIFHQAIDGEHHHIHSFKEFFQSFKNKEQWKRYIENFDLKRIGVRAVRAYNVEADKEGIKNHAKNLALIYPLSHTVEMMAAPVFMAMGTAGELPALVIAGGGFVLSLIAVPGIDPLCIAVLSLYPLKPVHKTIDKIRRGVEGAARFALRAFRINELRSRYYTEVDQLEHIKLLMNKQGQHNVEISSSGSMQKIVFKQPYTQKLLTEVNIQHNYVHSLKLNPNTYHEHDLVKEFSKVFSWSLKQAIQEAQKFTKNNKLQKLGSEFYIESLRAERSLVEINYKPHAIPINKISIKKDQVCKRLF